MTVRELIEALEALDPDLPVVVNDGWDFGTFDHAERIETATRDVQEDGEHVAVRCALIV